MPRAIEEIATPAHGAKEIGRNTVDSECHHPEQNAHLQDAIGHALNHSVAQQIRNALGGET